MSVVAHDVTVRVASAASQIARTRPRKPASRQLSRGLKVRRESSRQLGFLRAIPDMFGVTGVGEGQFVYYNEDLELLWFSDEEAVIAEGGFARERALD